MKIGDKDNMKTVYKPWGREEWMELNDRYCYKRIYINAGHKTSYQYHNFKRETNYIISGEAEVWLENDNGVLEKKVMKAGEFFNVSPPKKHRVIALTDIILQEVSTPEVDDVIRIEDDANRKDGRIEGEHHTPAVLILSAGLGTRLKKLTEHINKSLVPLNNKAVISHIIEKFPKDYDIVIAVGHKSDTIKEYCNLAHFDRKITFIDVDNFDGPGSGPGHSALQCKEHLQRPFYLTTADCILSGPLPPIDGNWLGCHPTSYPEKYSTVEVNNHDDVLSLVNKSENGHDLAFIGLAGIMDHDIFWKSLETRIRNGEVVSAWENPQSYPQLRVKTLDWLDVGNLDDLDKAKKVLHDTPLSLSKDVGEFTYQVNGKFLKFNKDITINKNRTNRAESLKHLIPPSFKSTNHFISYDWVSGKTLYLYDDLEYYCKFLGWFKNLYRTALDVTPEEFYEFYQNKTIGRINKFIEKYGEKYYTESLTINGKSYPSLKNLIDSGIDLAGNIGYQQFHGDLQFDNVIYDDKLDKFYYIDWRDSFGKNTEGGDSLYDISKLYGGSLISYDKMKNPKNITLVESFPSVDYKLVSTNTLNQFVKIFEEWVEKEGMSLPTIRRITSLIFINMAPLHDESFGKALWCKGIEMLYENR